jgi:diadenosine tetraphosphate (Ap4A) HIT family hydrolase
MTDPSGAAEARAGPPPDPPPDPACPFCSLPPERLWLANAHALAFRDAYPLTEGHTLVVPRRHVASVFDAPAPEQAALWALVAEVRVRLRQDYAPDGFTLGVNGGEAAGQTVGHGHVHVIPRRWGDVPDPKGGLRWLIPARARYWGGGGRPRWPGCGP